MLPALCAIALLLTSANAEVRTINDDEDFEETVIQSAEVWAVMFTSPSKGDDAVKAEKMMERLAMKMSGVHFGVADVDNVKTFSSEFNVRKRMVPRLLVFNSRARQADVIPMCAHTRST